MRAAVRSISVPWFAPVRFLQCSLLLQKEPSCARTAQPCRLRKDELNFPLLKDAWSRRRTYFETVPGIRNPAQAVPEVDAR